MKAASCRGGDWLPSSPSSLVPLSTFSLSHHSAQGALCTLSPAHISNAWFSFYLYLVLDVSGAVASVLSSGIDGEARRFLTLPFVSSSRSSSRSRSRSRSNSSSRSKSPAAKPAGKPAEPGNASKPADAKKVEEKGKRSPSRSRRFGAYRPCFSLNEVLTKIICPLARRAHVLLALARVPRPGRLAVAPARNPGRGALCNGCNGCTMLTLSLNGYLSVESARLRLLPGST